eukprot:scaffold25921_cov80-Skeletonema_marinoi.AAC.1
MRHGKSPLKRQSDVKLAYCRPRRMLKFSTEEATLPQLRCMTRGASREAVSCQLAAAQHYNTT